MLKTKHHGVEQADPGQLLLAAFAKMEHQLYDFQIFLIPSPLSSILCALYRNKLNTLSPLFYMFITS